MTRPAERTPWYKELHAVDYLFIVLTLSLLGFGLFLAAGGKI